MNLPDDISLLRRFLKSRDEAAFRALVEKYSGLVYGVALRRTRQPELAEEISQNVFLALSKKAGALLEQRSLGAWLHRAATLESLRHLRKHSRHLAMLEVQPTSRDESTWQEVRPLLDDLLNRLPKLDRTILIQHFLEGQTFKEIAPSIGLKPDAAQKRSVRALEKLSALLKRRGVTASGIVLASGLGAELGHAAPVTLSTQITSSVIATPATTLLTAMTVSKLTCAAVFAVSAMIPVGLGFVTSDSPEKITLSVASRPETQARHSLGFDPEIFRAKVIRYHKIEDPHVRSDQLDEIARELLALDENEIKQAIQVLDHFENENYLMSTAYARWAELDPFAANTDALAKETRPEAILGSWPTWGFANWDTAFAFAKDHQLNNLNQLAYRYFPELAKFDGPAALQRFEEFKKISPKNISSVRRDSLENWVKRSPHEALEWLDRETTDPLKKDQLLSSTLRAILRRNPSLALENLRRLQNPEQKAEILRAISLCRKDATHQWLKNLPEGEEKNWAHTIISK